MLFLDFIFFAQIKNKCELMCSLVVLALVLVNGELNITVLAYHWIKLYRHESDVSLLINLSKKKSELCKTANPIFHSSAPIQVCKSFLKIISSCSTSSVVIKVSLLFV